MDRKALSTIPHAPGCYLFKDSGGAVIYVGKAKDLRKRMSQYFAARQENPKTSAMMSRAASVDFVEVDSDEEAILLEPGLIRQHYPKYNIDLKDNSPLTYALVTSEEFPRVMISRKNRHGSHSGPAGKLYGPFMNSGRTLLLGPLRKAFKIRTCSKLPKKVCLQYHMGFCSGPCEGKIGKQEYLEGVRRVESLLSDEKNIDAYVGELRMRMRKASLSHDFEEAIRMRDSIRALQGLSSRQKIDTLSDRDEDYVAIVAENGRARAQVWRMVRGVIRERLKYEFDYVDEDIASSFLTAFYSGRDVPRSIYMNRMPKDAQMVQFALAKIKGGAVSVSPAPTRGQKAGLMRLIEKNIFAQKAGGADPALVLLQKELSLPRIPLCIECFDISNLQGKYVVGSMVQLVNAAPKKSEYRKFKVRTVQGQDDFASMREVVFRRYRRLRDEGAGLPDMVLVDGGLGQLHAALDALKMLEIDLPLFSLAKEDEEIYGTEMLVPLRLAKNSPALHVLQRARDEAHRFVITYHRKLRTKGMTGKK